MPTDNVAVETLPASATATPMLVGRRWSLSAPANDATDQADFEELYRQHWPSLRRLATLMTGNPQEGQDLAQEAFARWYVHRRGVDNAEAYLRITLLNLIRSRARRRNRVLRFAHVIEREARVAAEIVPQSGELADVVARLPERQRAAVILRYYEGRTEQEIAQVLGCRPGTVKSLLSRALHELRRVVER
jgi:RNA polymerase sigma-70 factor (sigma-E family)